MTEELKIQTGQCWFLKSDKTVHVIVKGVFFGTVFLYPNKIVKHLSERDFREKFQYSHYIPTHLEMG